MYSDEIVKFLVDGAENSDIHDGQKVKDQISNKEQTQITDRDDVALFGETNEKEFSVWRELKKCRTIMNLTSVVV